METNILGTEYKIILGNKENFSALSEMDGYTDSSIKQIVVDDCKDVENTVGAKKNMKEFVDKVLRHEIIHAFLYESGLAENSSWATEEEMIDFFAIQFPKIQKVFKELNIGEE